jgi:hypothetical protein
MVEHSLSPHDIVGSNAMGANLALAPPALLI